MKKQYSAISRRDFIKSTSRITAAAGAAALIAPSAVISAVRPKTRLAIVGTGLRGSRTWGKNLLRELGDKVEIVGLCDINPKRMKVANRWMGGNIPTFIEFDLMVRTVDPELIIVTTVDSLHAKYVCRAMELGKDVLCEKPLCTSAEQARKIIEIQKRTGRHVDVTFNLRFALGAMRVKELLLAGEIGELYSVQYDEFLDLDHGASYFRRWHGLRQCSGSLLVHKACHHFDQLNWWIDSDPEDVIASAALNRYGVKGPFRHSNCRVCTYKDKCEFYWDMTKHREYMELYAGCEDEDGYFRDGCVFRRGINVQDTYSAQIKYANGVRVSYSLNATVPYEGQMIVFNGSRGRIELRNYENQPWEVQQESELRLTRNYQGSKMVEIERQADDFFSHGGADVRIKRKIFDPGSDDPLNQRAGVRAGVMSSAIGIAGNISIDTGDRVRIDELVKFG